MSLSRLSVTGVRNLHPVTLTPGSLLQITLDSAAEGGSVQVNSMHHQSVKTLGAGLRVSAVAPDGVVEAVEGMGHSFVLGVQWHPEVFDAEEPSTRPLFEAFVKAAGEYGDR